MPMRNISTMTGAPAISSRFPRAMLQTSGPEPSDSVAAGYEKFENVKRVSPLFYTYSSGSGSIREMINDPKVASAFLDQVFFTLLNDRDGRILSTVPVLNYTDHTNGTSFYIRSVAQPDTYWHHRASSETVVAYQSRRSQFKIKIADDARGPGTIIIGSGEVYITTTSGVNVGAANRENLRRQFISSFANRDSKSPTGRKTAIRTWGL
ncbi:hypothetical protein FRB94_010102 [Tulasnella sp. JGI-2019a]|nr:hypothetical protein FRB94_010102 [Tulasnella sp. JGI-2019a]KAG9021667.1 hypothetical protein FRB95_001677 [Tulasnella sp. JGI-2019a]